MRQQKLLRLVKIIIAVILHYSFCPVYTEKSLVRQAWVGWDKTGLYKFF
jgi:hypothetical protein